MYVSKLKQHNTTAQTQKYDGTTIGTVVSTSDPQQMGRLKIVCSKWGDSFDNPIDELPWASYISPFGGDSMVGSRGPDIQQSTGTIAYGFWAIPKIGAQVLVMKLDNDPMHRVYLGTMYNQFTPHTLPHGRFKYDGHPTVNSDNMSTPYGPFTSSEHPIEPLNSNLRQSFGSSKTNYEWQTRAADYQVAAIQPNHTDFTESTTPDDYNVTDSISDWKSTQGYEATRYDPSELESKVVSLTSPGFHSLSMDDRIENCRMRFRTTSGHQVLLDDTNERIYISTAKGNNWVEMDQDGNIDVFSNTRINLHAVKDINITSDESVRIQAQKGIHLLSDTVINLQSKDDINVKSTAGNLRVGTAQSIYLSANQSIHTIANINQHHTSNGSMHLLSGGVLNASASDVINVNAGGDYIVTAENIHHNGPSATPATAAQPAAEKPAMWTNRVPTHEPFARTMTKTDYTHEPEHTYLSKLVNRMERGRTIIRGMFWRR